MLYKHKNNTDVAMEVLKKFYVKEKDVVKLKIRWWRVNRANDVLYNMNIVERFVIPRKVWLKDWEVI